MYVHNIIHYFYKTNTCILTSANNIYAHFNAMIYITGDARDSWDSADDHTGHDDRVHPTGQDGDLNHTGHDDEPHHKG